MKKDIFIEPSILSCDFTNLAREIRKTKRVNCPRLHLDVMDGHFVPNITFGPPLVKSIRSVTDQYLDCHLMIDDPYFFAKPFVEAGANQITFHYEAVKEPEKLMRRIKRLGADVGISIKPKTKIDTILDVLGKVNTVLVMTVEPGFGGQKMIASCLTKIRQLKLLKKDKNLDFIIQMDGGASLKTLPVILAAGAEIIVAGSSVFKDGEVEKNVREMRKVIREFKKESK